MAWQDNPITKSYERDSLLEILAQGLLGSMSRYTHFQIIEWCARYVDQASSNELDIEVADDIVVQWELFIASQYTLEQMRHFSLSDIVLPKPYFETWLKQLLDDEPAVH